MTFNLLNCSIVTRLNIFLISFLLVSGLLGLSRAELSRGLGLLTKKEEKNLSRDWRKIADDDSAPSLQLQAPHTLVVFRPRRRSSSPVRLHQRWSRWYFMSGHSTWITSFLLFTFYTIVINFCFSDIFLLTLRGWERSIGRAFRLAARNLNTVIRRKMEIFL